MSLVVGILAVRILLQLCAYDMHMFLKKIIGLLVYGSQKLDYNTCTYIQ